MSLIVRILDMMDRQLAAALAAGQTPAHFLLRREDWAEIVERFKELPSDTVSTVEQTYHGVPVRTQPLGDDDLSRLVIA